MNKITEKVETLDFKGFNLLNTKFAQKIFRVQEPNTVVLPQPSYDLCTKNSWVTNDTFKTPSTFNTIIHLSYQ